MKKYMGKSYVVDGIIEAKGDGKKEEETDGWRKHGTRLSLLLV